MRDSDENEPLLKPANRPTQGPPSPVIVDVNAAAASYNSGSFSSFSPKSEHNPSSPQPNNDKRPKLHKTSLACVMFLGFIANVEYGVIMPSVWQYIESVDGNESQLGMAISACSFAQLLFLPIFGYWSDRRSMREASCVAITIGIMGNFIYANADLGHSPWFIILGRLFVGIYSGVMAVSNSYIAAVTTIEQRTRFMATINGINAIGLVSGPGFNIFLAKMDFQIGKYIKVSPLTSPGWLIGALLCFAFVAYLTVFVEPSQQHNNNKAGEKHLQTPPPTSNTASNYKTYLKFIRESYKKPYIACFVVTFVQNFDFSVLETILTPLTKANYNFETFQNSVLYSGISLEMIIVIVIAAIVSGKASDIAILLFGEAFMGAGLILNFILLNRHTPLWLFLLCVGVLIVGLPSQNTAIMGAYTKFLTKEFGPGKQGLYTGVMMLFGSLARILGPLWGGWVGAISLKIMFALLLSMWVIEVIVTFVFLVRKRNGDLRSPPQVLSSPSSYSVNTSETNPLLSHSQD